MYPGWAERNYLEIDRNSPRGVKLLLDITQILEISSNLKFLSATLKTFWELGSQVPTLFPPLHTTPHRIITI
jgi:hypothetical protein